MGRIVGAIVLPEAWMDRVLARIHLEDEVAKAARWAKSIKPNPTIGIAGMTRFDP